MRQKTPHRKVSGLSALKASILCKMTFLQYLKTQQFKQTAIGDFARDVLADRERPRLKGLKEWCEYLWFRDASRSAVKACEGAWEAFQREQAVEASARHLHRGLL